MSFGVRQTWVCSPGLLLSSCQLQFAMCEMGITATSHSEGGFDDSVTGIPQYSLHMWSACVQQALFPSLVSGLVAVLWRVCRAGQEAAEGHLCQPLTRVLSPAFSQVVENTSTTGFPVHHQLLELAQTHVHPVGDAIGLSYPLSPPPPPAYSLSQHQGLFQ